MSYLNSNRTLPFFSFASRCHAVRLYAAIIMLSLGWEAVTGVLLLYPGLHLILRPSCSTCSLSTAYVKTGHDMSVVVRKVQSYGATTLQFASCIWLRPLPQRASHYTQVWHCRFVRLWDQSDWGVTNSHEPLIVRISKGWSLRKRYETAKIPQWSTNTYTLIWSQITKSTLSRA